MFLALTLSALRIIVALAHADGHTTDKKGNAEMAKTKKEAATEDIELDELDADVAEDEAPAKGKSKSKEPEVTFGVRDLAEHLTKVTGKTVTPKDLRTQIRRMAREDKPRVEREIVAGNRSRYDWPDGLKDPEVKAIIAAVTGGELEEGKKAALQKLKDDKAAKKAAKKEAEGDADEKPAKSKSKK